MVATLAALLVALAIYFAWIYMKAKNRTLKRNGRVGLRTKAIMTSDETWKLIHRKYAMLFLVQSAIMLLMAVDLTFSCVLTRSISVFQPTCLIVLWVSLIILVAVTGITGVRANSDAQKHNLNNGV